MKTWLISHVFSSIGFVLLLFAGVSVILPEPEWFISICSAFFLLLLLVMKKKKEPESVMFVSAAFSGAFFGLGYNNSFYLVGIMAGAVVFMDLVKLKMNFGSSDQLLEWFLAAVFAFAVCFAVLRSGAPLVIMSVSSFFIFTHLGLFWLWYRLQKRRQKAGTGQQE